MKHRSEQERHEIVDDYQRSGLTQEAYAEKHRINVGTLRGWIYRPRASKAKVVKPRFVEVKGPDLVAGPRVVIRFGRNLSLELDELPDPAFICQLARALEC